MEPGSTPPLIELARLGVMLHRDGEEVAWRTPPEAQTTGIDALIRDHRAELREASANIRQPLRFLCPLSKGASGAQSRGAIVLVHALGGGVSIYTNILNALAPEYRVYGLQCFHWINNRSLPSSIEEMAHQYLGEIKQIGVPIERLVIAGVSSAGLIALEMARALAAEGTKPLALVMGDTRETARTASSITSALVERMLWACFVEVYAPWSLPKPLPAAHVFWTLDYQQRFDYIVRRAEELSWPASMAPLSVTRLPEYFETYRAYFQIYAAYRPRAYTGRVVYLASTSGDPRPATTVREQLSGSVRVEPLEGGHLGMLDLRHAARVARIIEQEYDPAPQG